MADLAALVADAAAALDDAVEAFVVGHRADSAVQKKGNELATEVDLAIFTELTRVCGKIRMHDSTAIDLASVGAGILGAPISFGHRIWDHAAGVALVRAAGGTVTDLDGAPWTPDSRSALAAAPGVHEQVLEIAHRVGSPEDYR